MLKTKHLTDFYFLTIRRIRTKALIETRIEHAKVLSRRLGDEPSCATEQTFEREVLLLEVGAPH
jgi:hypothetical protein